jgi:hypothetical protein
MKAKWVREAGPKWASATYAPHEPYGFLPNSGSSEGANWASACRITCAILASMPSNCSSRSALALSWSRVPMLSRRSTSQAMGASRDRQWVLRRCHRTGAWDALEPCRRERTDLSVTDAWII